MKFESYEEIYKLIASANNECYPKIKTNTFFLEQANSKNYIKVMQEIRDAFDHLYHILAHKDPFSEEAQTNINSEFEKYKGHMQRLAIETLRKVIEYYSVAVKSYLDSKNRSEEWTIIRTQIAVRVKVARDREANGNFHDRYAAWEDVCTSLINLYDDLTK